MNEIVKDKARQERLNQVYRHLYAHYGIDSQKKDGTGDACTAHGIICYEWKQSISD